ncbi:MAG: baseplate J/gp47 family protein [Rhizobium rosettiformans]
MTVIDLSQLPAPSAVETIDFEAIVSEIKSDFLARWDARRASDTSLPAYDTLDLESDPVAILIQAVAYREILLRARFNDGIRQVLLAFATGSNLDHLGAYLEVERLAGETDDRYRRRIQLAPEALSTAGPEGAYIYHALTAVAALIDVSCVRSDDGEVTVTLLAGADIPQPSAAQIEAVRVALEQTNVVPLTDTIIVQGPTVAETAVVVELTLYPGPDGALIKAEVEAALAQLKLVNSRLNQDLTRSAIYGRAHREGVQAVRILAPSEDIKVTKSGYVRITGTTVTIGGTDI